MLVIMSVIWCGEDMTKKFLYKHAGIFGCEKKTMLLHIVLTGEFVLPIEKGE